MIAINHIRQIKDGFNWKCGAVCLDMVFRYYGIEKEQDEIWRKVKAPRYGGQMFARSANLAKYSIECGLPATIYKTSDTKCIEFLNNLGPKDLLSVMSVQQKLSMNGDIAIEIDFDFLKNVFRMKKKMHELTSVSFFSYK